MRVKLQKKLKHQAFKLKKILVHQSVNALKINGFSAQLSQISFGCRSRDLHPQHWKLAFYILFYKLFRKPFHLLICDREFASELINKLIQPKLEPPQVS
jgi:hypothetical protein